jgi:Xaa-Pro dipeptidase
MRAAEVDVLLLGREANARYVSDANRLWLAGTRPFAPACAVVREPASAHLLSITDDGVPPAIPSANLYPISWNPMTLVTTVAAIPGVAAARRVGVDGMSPLFEALLGGLLTDAELVDGEALLRDVRRVKSDADVASIREAVSLARHGLQAVTDAIEPGVRERELAGIFSERVAARGVTTPAFAPVCCIADPGEAPRAFVTDDRALAEGDLVHIRVGVLRHGWEGALAGTWRCGGAAVDAAAAFGTTVAMIRAGATVGALRATGAVVDGIGLGHEELADHDPLEPGMTLWIERFDDPVLTGEVVLVTDGEPDVFATPHG